jgi:RNA polymerase sigma factor (TIGR02999 family)
LNTTALVHEAYLKLVDPANAGWHDRSHFLAVAATAMRHILVDYARQRTAQKRGGDDRQVSLEEGMLGIRIRAEEMLAINQALHSLAAVDQRLVRTVELRFFGGLTVAETAKALEVSEPTVKRDWRKARAFLFRTLQPQTEE